MIRRRNSLERRLRSEAPQPREDFVASLAGTVEARRPRVTSRLAFIAAAVTLLLGTAASLGGVALAQTPANDQYVEQAPEEEQGGALPATTQPPPEVITAAPTGGTLPFTGVSLAATAVVGLGLTGAGLFLRRVERRNREDAG